MQTKMEELAMLIRAAFPGGVTAETFDCFRAIVSDFREMLGMFEPANGIHVPLDPGDDGAAGNKETAQCTD